MKKLITLVVLIIIAVILLSVVPRKTAPEAPIQPAQATLSGVQVCLPHKDTSGPVTTECTSGLRTEDGKYYALNFALMSEVPPEIDYGQKFTASGVVTPVTQELEKYDIVGVFSVTSGVTPEGEEKVISGATNLEGTWVWKHTVLKTGTKRTPVKAGAFTITFKADGSLTGTTDCNSYFGGYTLKDTQGIVFSPFGTTKMFCEGSQEDAFRGMVSNSSAYTVNGRELILKMDDGAGDMIFEKKV